MIACLSPSDLYYEENLSTLKYATQASKIRNKPVVNIDEKILQIKELKEKVRQLQLELKNANDHIEFLSSMQNIESKKFGIYLLGEFMTGNNLTPRELMG